MAYKKLRYNGFPKDFVWGTATASYQVEGAFNEDGRGLSIWDTFAKVRKQVKGGHNGDIACDQFHRYQEDVQLMRELGVASYRFSIAWPRIFPESIDKQNSQNSIGFDYYHRLIDELLKHGITPAITLYHWDLPQYLEDEGGWANRQTAYHFANYAEACFKELGDKVKNWITINESFCAGYLGYLMGIHAPGVANKRRAYDAVHHLNLGHGLAVKKFRDSRYSGEIGITHNLAASRPATNRREDFEASERFKDFGSRMFTDPQFKGSYPQRFVAAEELNLPIQDGDMELISQKLDFLGLNYYCESAIAHDPHNPPHYLKEVPDYYDRMVLGPIVPGGLSRLLLWIKEEYGDIPIYITENGCGLEHFEDTLNEDKTRCHDQKRIHYLRGHFQAMREAIAQGVNLKGYYLWSLMDNFEWAEGYYKRFGIIYCDYKDQQRRIPKDSYYYYREVVAGNEK